MRHQALTKQAAHSGDDGEKNKAGNLQYSVLYGVYGCLHVSGKEVLLSSEADSAALSHTGGFRVGGGVHDSYTFQCGLVGSFTSRALA